MRRQQAFIQWLKSYELIIGYGGQHKASGFVGR